MKTEIYHLNGKKMGNYVTFYINYLKDKCVFMVTLPFPVSFLRRHIKDTEAKTAWFYERCKNA